VFCFLYSLIFLANAIFGVLLSWWKCYSPQGL
jgi:hypothetical protein